MRTFAHFAVAVILVGAAGCTDDREPAASTSSTVRSTLEPAVPTVPLDVDDLTGTWLDAEGAAVPPTNENLVLDVGLGPEHCGMDRALILIVTVPFGAPDSTVDDWRVFVRDPEKTLVGPPWDTLSDLELDSELPPTAQFTGFSTGDLELWVDRDQQHAFLTDGHTVERWPRVDPPPLCA